MPRITFKRPALAETGLPPLRLRIERIAPALLEYSVEEGDEVLARAQQDSRATQRMRARLGQDAYVGDEFGDQPRRFLLQIGLFALRIEAAEHRFIWELEDAGDIIGRAEQTRDADREMRRQLGTDAPLTLQPAARTRRRKPTAEAEIALARDVAARKG